METGIDTIAGGFQNLIDWLEDGASISASLNLTLTRAATANSNFYASCVLEVARVVPELNGSNYPAHEIESHIQTAQTEVVEKLFVTMEDMRAVLIESTNTINVYRNYPSTLINVLASTMIFITLWFAVGTTLYFFTPDREHSLRPAGVGQLSRRASRCSCWMMFSIGILLVAAFILVCAVLNLLSTVMADMCVPDPNQFLQRIIAQATSTSMLDATANCQESMLMTSRFADGYSLPMSQLSAADTIAYILCYYQTCTGENTYAKALNLVNENRLVAIDLVEDYQSKLRQFINETDSPEIPRVQQCLVDSFEVLIVLLLLIGDLEGLAGLVSCSRVNRIYFELFQDGLCNQTLGYLVILW
eukprot:CAMPEP_0184007940 /NCGR_PEP_ID=MMETSP0954-20121128/1652_1 /TAXON_ID=627963 /ORGANISM="Aplanochytrium sp, Strain PBS07" /LENGTH=359 /DNA_ID=CAMNT_0026286905 /DNA_START=435 /DNA_END=1511 /DNA_ORIENTATION=-